jgi:hypothetical protein
MRGAQFAIGFVSALAVTLPVLAVEQPLNRVDCEKAGMQWDDNANVCGSNEKTAVQVIAPKIEKPTKSVTESKPTPAMVKSSKKTAASSHRKQVAKNTSHRKHANYKKQPQPVATKPVNRRPFQWLFPNAHKRAGAL